MDPKRFAAVKDAIKKISEGKTLKSQLVAYNLHPMDFFAAIKRDAALFDNYALARESRVELLVEELIEIADTEPDPNRARVMIDTRKWYASKMRPDKYGERLDVSVSGSVDIRGALEDAKRRVISLRDSRNISDAELIDTPSQIAKQATECESVLGEQDAEDIFS
jgi:hypothetical protein